MIPHPIEETATSEGDVTVHHCPIAECPWWVRERPTPPYEHMSTVGIRAETTRRAGLLEDLITEHVNTHPLWAWAREVMRLREVVEKSVGGGE